ncbi:MAG: 30S ribosomal protein S17e [archaeon]|nr:30S ribosomal protein S17e [archaeon]MCP8306385.1 30S ribosomal protein S17e [archaeon]
MNRIKRISIQVLEKYGDLFTDDFDKNKAVLGQVSTVRSKHLRNKIAGYITSLKRKEEEGEAVPEEASEDEGESE